MCVFYFSACCLCDTYLTKLPIQKPIKTPLGNFATFFGRIASCFCQSLSRFTKGSQKSLVVAIYSEIKSRNCQDLVKVESFITDILKSRFFIIAQSPKGLQKSKLFVAQQDFSCSESAP